MRPGTLTARLAALDVTPTTRVEGRVVSIRGQQLHASVPGARLGDRVAIRRSSGVLLGEIIGLEDVHALIVAAGDLRGVGIDDPVELVGSAPTVPVGPSLLGRVVDGLGAPLDGGPALGPDRGPLDRAAPPALERPLLARRLSTGVRVVDGLTALAEGQRVGLFAGPGVGKSTLLGQLARGANVDATVVCLVGERGREVREFIEHELDPEAAQRTVMVVATSDASALERRAAPRTATAIAEAFREEGKRVLLVIDSLTRFARACRDVALAAGEPTVRRGFPASVFAELPRLLERAGTDARGSVTAIYSVLVERDELEDPIADEVRGLLDGHIVLDRDLAERGRYPAVDPVRSLSRIADRVLPSSTREAASAIRRALAHYEAKRDLVLLGATKPGADPQLDRVLAALPDLERFLAQRPDESTDVGQTDATLVALAARITKPS